MSAITPRLGKQNIVYRVINKLYRHLIEEPRRESLKDRLLSLPPSISADKSLGFTLHMMVCKRDLKMAVCSALVANFHCGVAFDWIFHDDGSLNNEDERFILSRLPKTKVVRRQEADTFANEKLKAYPKILDSRRNQIMALKIVDVRIWGKGDKFGYVDSDVLFVKKPDFYLDALANREPKNYFNKDIKNAYVKSSDQIEEAIGIRPFERGNAGLWVMHRQDIDLDKIEEWLNHPGFSDCLYDYTLDQTFINMLAKNSSNGVDYFPVGYDVNLYKTINEQVIDKHYVGAIRHGYELEGLDYLLNRNSFEKNWLKFINDVN